MRGLCRDFLDNSPYKFIVVSNMVSFHKRSHQTIIILVFTALLFASIFGISILGGCAAPTAGQHKETAVARSRHLATVSENDVTVAIDFERDPAGDAWLVGTFTPARENFHLYSKDLEKNSKYGLGRPTLLEIASPGPVKPIGVLVTNQPVEYQYSRPLNESLPVYPVGPVILRLHIEFPPGEAPAQTELAVTYMACSDTTCLKPVIDKLVSVVIP